MTARTPNEEDEKARRYFLRISNHNFHDAVVEQIQVQPARSKRGRAQIEVLLSFPEVEILFSLTFAGCTNTALALDFDVLADNLEANTMRLWRFTDSVRVWEFIYSQVPKWNVEYTDIGSPEWGCSAPHASPLPAKRARVKSLKLYRLKFFGGELSVTATSHQVKTLDFEKSVMRAGA